MQKSEPGPELRDPEDKGMQLGSRALQGCSGYSSVIKLEAKFRSQGELEGAEEQKFCADTFDQWDFQDRSSGRQANRQQTEVPSKAITYGHLLRGYTVVRVGPDPH